MRQILVQNVSVTLLANATRVYYKIHLVFLLQNATILLQNATVITKCDDFITKYNSYYKMRDSLQTATVHLGHNYSRTVKPIIEQGTFIYRFCFYCTKIGLQILEHLLKQTLSDPFNGRRLSITQLKKVENLNPLMPSGNKKVTQT